MNRERKSLRIRTDVLEQLESHKDRTGISKQDTADVGLFLAVNLTRESFQKVKDKLTKGQKVTNDDLEVDIAV